MRGSCAAVVTPSTQASPTRWSRVSPSLPSGSPRSSPITGHVCSPAREGVSVVARAGIQALKRAAYVEAAEHFPAGSRPSTREGRTAAALELADETLALGDERADPVRLAEGAVQMYLAHFDLACEDLRAAFTQYRQPGYDQIYEMRARGSVRSPTWRWCSETWATTTSRSSAAT